MVVQIGLCAVLLGETKLTTQLLTVGFAHKRVLLLSVLSIAISPSYLAETLHLTSNVESRRRLRSGSTSTLLVPTSRRTTLGDRAFPVAVAWAWNALPASVRTAESYIAFRRQIETLLFKASFNDDRTRLRQL